VCRVCSLPSLATTALQDVVSKYPLALFNDYPQVLTFLTGNKTKVQRHLVSPSNHSQFATPLLSHRRSCASCDRVCRVCDRARLLKSEEVIRKYKVGATKYAFGGDSEQCVTFPWIDVDTEGRNAIRYTE
jgi:hypothetical protein